MKGVFAEPSNPIPNFTSNDMNVVSTDTRLCTKCGAEKLLTEFRRVRRNQPERHSECRSCRNRRRRDLTVARKQKDARKALRRIVEAADNQRVQALTNCLIQRLGGVRAAANLLKREIDSANPSDRIRYLFALARMGASLRHDRSGSQ